MINGVLFVLFSLIAVAGAVGVLLGRRTTHSLLAFLACGGAVGGLFLLLGLQVAAAVQLLLCMLMVGAMFASLPPGGKAADDGRMGEWLWSLVVALAVAGPLMWGVARGLVGEPVLGAPPMWAVRQSHLAALGEEWVARHTVLLMLLGAFLLVGMVGAAYLGGRKDR